MILAIDDIAPEVADTLKKLATVYPFPQLSVWEGLAKRLYDQGKTAEACYTLDLTAKPYGKDVARHAAERVTRIPAHLKGRGIPAAWHERLHPASTLLCDHTLPLRLGTRLSADQTRCQRDVVEDGEVGEEVEVLKHHAHVAAQAVLRLLVGLDDVNTFKVD